MIFGIRLKQNFKALNLMTTHHVKIPLWTVWSHLFNRFMAMLARPEVFFVHDLIHSLTLFMNYSNKSTINLGNPGELSIVEILNLIRNLSIKKVNLKFLKI